MGPQGKIKTTEEHRRVWGHRYSKGPSDQVAGFQDRKPLGYGLRHEDTMRRIVCGT